MNALGRYLFLSVKLYHQTDRQVCTGTILAIGYNYFQAITGAAPTPDAMALIVGRGDVSGIQWDELKTCGLFLSLA
jgi:predicted sugar kinase